jgi:hypothetical protein
MNLEFPGNAVPKKKVPLEILKLLGSMKQNRAALIARV